LLGLLKRLLNIYVFCILQIEICSPINGDVRFTVPNVSDAGLQPEDDSVVGLHLPDRNWSCHPGTAKLLLSGF